MGLSHCHESFPDSRIRGNDGNVIEHISREVRHIYLVNTAYKHFYWFLRFAHSSASHDAGPGFKR